MSSSKSCSVDLLISLVDSEHLIGFTSQINYIVENGFIESKFTYGNSLHKVQSEVYSILHCANAADRHILAQSSPDNEVLAIIFNIVTANVDNKIKSDIGWILVSPKLSPRRKILVVDTLVSEVFCILRSYGYTKIECEFGTEEAIGLFKRRFGFSKIDTLSNDKISFYQDVFKIIKNLVFE